MAPECLRGQMLGYEEAGYICLRSAGTVELGV